MQTEEDEEEHKMKRALEEIVEIYPQCKKCLYHFKNVVTLNKHKCSGPQVRKDANSLAMCNANTILGTRNEERLQLLFQQLMVFQPMLLLKVISFQVGLTVVKTCIHS